MPDSAQYQARGSILAVIDGEEVVIPDNMQNPYRQKIAERGIEVAAYVAPPPPVPDEVSAWKAEVVLERRGLLSLVEAELAQLSEEDQIRWRRVTTVRRNHPLLTEVAESLNLTQEQIDEMFQEADALT